MGYPDPQHPGGHPGDQNYPASPGTPKPTRAYERDEFGAPQVPPTGPQTGPPAPQNPPVQGDGGGYQLGYAQGAYGTEQYGGNGPYGDQYGGTPPPQGPPPGPGGNGGGGDGSGGSGGNKKVLWIAAAAVVFVLVLAAIVVLVATGGTESSTASSNTTTTTTTTTAPSSTRGGINLPSGIPSGISIPPIFGGGSTTGPDARQWEVEVTGNGSAQLVTVGVPDTSLFGTQPLPWSKRFTSDAFLVSITVIGYTGDVSCKITRNGTVVADEKSGAETSNGGPLICSAGR